MHSISQSAHTAAANEVNQNAGHIVENPHLVLCELSDALRGCDVTADSANNAGRTEAVLFSDHKRFRSSNAG